LYLCLYDSDASAFFTKHRASCIPPLVISHIGISRINVACRPLLHGIALPPLLTSAHVYLHYRPIPWVVSLFVIPSLSPTSQSPPTGNDRLMSPQVFRGRSWIVLSGGEELREAEGVTRRSLYNTQEEKDHEGQHPILPRAFESVP